VDSAKRVTTTSPGCCNHGTIAAKTLSAHLPRQFSRALLVTHLLARWVMRVGAAHNNPLHGLSVNAVGPAQLLQRLQGVRCVVNVHDDAVHGLY